MGISTEYGIIGTEFTPFNDLLPNNYIPAPFDTGGIDTREVDSYRQGVEIITARHRFAGMQPKIWAGNIKHYVNVNVLGQARSFTEFENNPTFKDLPIFDPVSFIELGNNYPFPIIFNKGPQQEEEAIIEPITIPFRKNSNEGKNIAHRVHGSLEDGNNFQDFNRSANRIQQFISYKELEFRFFLDDGGDYVGLGTIQNSIIIPQYVSTHEGQPEFFDETSVDDLVESIKTNDIYFTNILKQMDYNIDEDLRPNQSKSANAGFFVYGGNSSQYGTDSIAYLGRFRGV